MNTATTYTRRDDLYEKDPAQCPLDGEQGAYLGQLGKLEHFRCRACGIVFNRNAEPPRNEGENVS